MESMMDKYSTRTKYDDDQISLDTCIDLSDPECSCCGQDQTARKRSLSSVTLPVEDRFKIFSWIRNFTKSFNPFLLDKKSHLSILQDGNKVLNGEEKPLNRPSNFQPQTTLGLSDDDLARDKMKSIPHIKGIDRIAKDVSEHYTFDILSFPFQLRNSKGQLRNAEIEKLLEKYRKEESMEVRVFLTGYPESISTLLTSMKIASGIKLSSDELEKLKQNIYRHIVRSMQRILTNMEVPKIKFENQGNEIHASTVLDQPVTMNVNIRLEEIAIALNALWNDSGLIQSFQDLSKKLIFDHEEYLFDSINRIAQPEYTPTLQDMLWVRLDPVFETFIVNEFTFRIINLVGLRSCDRKWKRCLQSNVALLLFVVDMTTYNKIIFEEEKRTMLHESLQDFDSLCNNPWFTHTYILLFFHKVDMFQSQIVESPLNCFFPDYSDGMDFEAARTYIRNRFLSACKDLDKKIHVHYSSSKDELSLGKLALESMRQLIQDDRASSSSRSSPSKNGE